jgi:hypothetical protein
MPTFDGGDDFVWVCGPCEGLWRWQERFMAEGFDSMGSKITGSNFFDAFI